MSVKGAGSGSMRIVVASKNPVKIETAFRAFKAVFPDASCACEGVSAESQVSSQPLSDRETLVGAQNRVVNARSQVPDADFYVGIEGGVEDCDNELHCFAWIVVESKEGKRGKARSAAFIVPPEIRRLIIEEGKELGDADDIVFGGTNTKQKNGSIGLLTNDVITRTELYRHATVAALIPFIHEHLYEG